MVGLAVPSTYFCPLDPKYLFCDAPRVLDGPPGSPKFPRDHYIIGDVESLLHLKNLHQLMSHLNSSVGLVEDLRVKGPRIETRCRFFVKLLFSSKRSKISPIFFPLKLCTAIGRSWAKWGPFLCENILQCGPQCVGGNWLVSTSLSEKPSSFYLIAYYIPIWEVVQTLVFPMMFHGLNLFFKSFQLPRGC